MRNTIILTVVALLSFQNAFAETIQLREQQTQKRSVWWKVSAVALAVATSVDAHSSWGHVEANPALRGPNGRFGTKGVALKGLITGSVLTAQYFMMKNHPKAEKYGTWTNFILAGALGSAAAYNYNLQRNSASVQRLQQPVTASNPR